MALHQYGGTYASLRIFNCPPYLSYLLSDLSNRSLWSTPSFSSFVLILVRFQLIVNDYCGRFDHETITGLSVQITPLFSLIKCSYKRKINANSAAVPCFLWTGSGHSFTCTRSISQIYAAVLLPFLWTSSSHSFTCTRCISQIYAAVIAINGTSQ